MSRLFDAFDIAQLLVNQNRFNEHQPFVPLHRVKEIFDGIRGRAGMRLGGTSRRKVSPRLGSR